MPTLLKKTFKVSAFIYAVTLPISFLVGGILYTRPIRSPLKATAVTGAMNPEWGDAFRRDTRELKIPVTARVRFSATLLGPDSGVCVLVLHASGGTRLDTLPLGYKLWKQGLGVVLLDRRAHGSSEGEAQPLFLNESADLKAIVDWLIEENVVGTSKLGIVGVGDAGTSALLLAAADTRIDAVGTVDPVLTARDYISRRIAVRFPLPRTLFVPHADLAARAMALFSGASYRDADARSGIVAVDGPVFVLTTTDSGAADDARAVRSALLRAKVEQFQATPDNDGYDNLAAFLRRSM